MGALIIWYVVDPPDTLRSSNMYVPGTVIAPYSTLYIMYVLKGVKLGSKYWSMRWRTVSRRRPPFPGLYCMELGICDVLSLRTASVFCLGQLWLMQKHT